MKTSEDNIAKQQLRKPVDLKSLPPAQARVEIAKDVLAALTLEVFEPCTGVYATGELRDAKPGTFEGVDLKEAFAGKRVRQCQVCARGALFLAKVGRLDGVNMNRHGGFGFDRSTLDPHLLEFFNPGQLELIESAFEGQDMRSASSTTTRDDTEAAVAFGQKHYPALYRSRVSRALDGDLMCLTAIMKNIVKNKGEFKP